MYTESKWKRRIINEKTIHWDREWRMRTFKLMCKLVRHEISDGLSPWYGKLVLWVGRCRFLCEDLGFFGKESEAKRRATIVAKKVMLDLMYPLSPEREELKDEDCWV